MAKGRTVKTLGLLCALLWLLPAHAGAAPEHMPYDAALCLSYRTLTDAQQALFDRLYDALLLGAEEVPLPEHTRYEDASVVMHTLLRDCPELCALDSSFTLLYYRNTPEEAHGVAVEYVLPPQTQAQLLELAQETACTGGDALSREEALHTLLCRRVTYDETAPNRYSAYGALCEGSAVCEGYAEAMALLYRLSGVGCSVVSGSYLPDGQTRIAHSWNMVQIGNDCAWLDVTLDDQQETAFYYFNLTDAQLCADHLPDESRALLPACDAPELNWYVRHGLMAPDEPEELRDFLYEHFRGLWRDGEPVRLRFSGAETYRAVSDGLDGLLAAWRADEPDAAAGESYAVISVPAQHCLTLLP